MSRVAAAVRRVLHDEPLSLPCPVPHRPRRTRPPKHWRLRQFRKKRRIRLVGWEIYNTISVDGVTSVPTDSSTATQAGPTVTVDKDAGPLSLAQAGDWILAWVMYRANITSDTALKNNASGGQYWDHLRQGPAQSTASGTVTGRFILCRRFSGTWSADPSFSIFSLDAPTGTLALTVVVFVIRPTSSSKWPVVEFNNCATFTATGTTKTITGVTPANNSNISIGCFFTGDDNEWGSVSGTNWSQITSPSAQFRNTTGTDTSCAFVQQVQTSAAATNNVSLTQSTLGGDAGQTNLITISEVDLPTGGTAGTGAFVQRAFAEAASADSTLSATLSSASTAGNTLCALYHHETTGQANTTSVTDDGGNTYIQLMIQADTGLDQIACWYFCPNANVANTVTATLSVAEIFSAIHFLEFNGALHFEAASGIQWRGTDDFTGLNIACPSVTPAGDNRVLVGQAFRTGGGDKTDLADVDGWTSATPAATEADMVCYQVQTTPPVTEDMDIDSVAPNSGSGGNAGNTLAGFIVLKPATAATVLPPRNFAALAAVHRAASW